MKFRLNIALFQPSQMPKSKSGSVVGTFIFLQMRVIIIEHDLPKSFASTFCNREMAQIRHSKVNWWVMVQRVPHYSPRAWYN
jgi:hypothetical protein